MDKQTTSSSDAAAPQGGREPGPLAQAGVGRKAAAPEKARVVEKTAKKAVAKAVTAKAALPQAKAARLVSAKTVASLKLPSGVSPRDLLLLDNQLCFALYSASLTMTKVYKPLLGALGVTYPQYLALLVLWERDDLMVSELGERLFLDSGTLTPLLKRMEAMGLVSRRRSAEDERQVLVSLTAEGKKLYQKAGDVPAHILCAAECSIGEIAALTRDVQKLRGALAKNVDDHELAGSLKE